MFDSIPSLVIICVNKSNYIFFVSKFLTTDFIARSYAFVSGGTTQYYFAKRNNTTIEWYSDYPPSSTVDQAEYQANINGVVYDYIAFF